MVHRKPLLTDAENKNVAFGSLFWIGMSALIICSKNIHNWYENIWHLWALQYRYFLSVFAEKGQIFLRLAVGVPVLEQVVQMGKQNSEIQVVLAMTAAKGISVPMTSWGSQHSLCVLTGDEVL